MSQRSEDTHILAQDPPVPEPVGQVPSGIGDVTPQIPTGDFGAKMNLLLSWGMWAGMIAAIFGIIICGAMMVYERLGNGGNESSKKLLAGLVGCIFIAGASGLVNGLIL